MHKKEEMYFTLINRPEHFFIDPFIKNFPSANVFLVGGALRDLLLDRVSEKTDFDFVIQHVLSETIESWFSMIGKINFVGKAFGVFKFQPFRFNEEIDITLPRTEKSIENSHGAYRDVETNSDPELPIETDLSRRDFTINAMAFDIKTGKIIDPFHGKIDLKKRLIRAVGNPTERFNEDLTRIMRAIRFAVELNFNIEKKTLKAIQSKAPDLNLKIGEDFIVARETIGKEFAKAFTYNPLRTIRLLQETHVFKILFPEISKLIAIDPHYLEPLEKAEQIELALALFLRGLTKTELEETIQRVGIATTSHSSPFHVDITLVVWLIEKIQKHFTREDIALMRASHFEKCFISKRGNILIRALELLNEIQQSDLARERKNEILNRWSVDYDEPIHSLVSGEDVLRCGIPAGHRVREILERVRDEQLEGRILSREAAIQFIKNR